MSVELLQKLNDALEQERKHLGFYLYHASAVIGLHAQEYSEFLFEQAKSELEHVKQFQDLLLGLGASLSLGSKAFPVYENIEYTMSYALLIETEVVENYTALIASLDSVPVVTLTTADGGPQPVGLTAADLKWIEIFLEKQIEDSRQDLDRIKRILA